MRVVTALAIALAGFLFATQASAQNRYQNIFLLGELFGKIESSSSMTQESFFGATATSLDVYFMTPRVGMTLIEKGTLDSNLCIFQVEFEFESKLGFVDEGCDGEALGSTQPITNFDELEHMLSDSEYFELLQVAHQVVDAINQFGSVRFEPRFTMLFDIENALATRDAVVELIRVVENFPNSGKDLDFTVEVSGGKFGFKAEVKDGSYTKCTYSLWIPDRQRHYRDHDCDGAYEAWSVNGVRYEYPRDEGSEVALMLLWRIRGHLPSPVDPRS